ncbi:hypothetical protein EDEG_03946 [Edhazardia aedis USNM 41457]|uniref:Uncharacterized protein n=1 Tax=Edhazardia aedis (strain USNM 41457) TaxID=1003232 RepID=J9DFU1_EDHAE|nr:hypothetical protein EDEG_03946 [Edhazardia aedis USNM 41457]|eukprot:EJW01470.1 hypothetical protein EDEG_03946 [Edhazardia aedis USNM 41457]
MSDSRTMLSTHIKTQPDFKSRKHKFLKTTKVWLKQRHLENVLIVGNATREILKKRYAILESRDSTVIGQFGKELRQGLGRMLRRLQLSHKCDPYGVQVLLRLRTGCF